MSQKRPHVLVAASPVFVTAENSNPKPMYLDIFVLVVVLYALVRGWMNGLLKEVASIAGIIVGLVIASTCYGTLGQYLAVSGSGVNMVTSVVAFFLLWILVPIALGFVANILTKALDCTLLSLPNRALGALVSLVKFTLLLSCALSAMQALGILNPERTRDSHLFQPATQLTATLVDCVMEEAALPIAPADTTASDTVWVDVQKP